MSDATPTTNPIAPRAPAKVEAGASGEEARLAQSGTSDKEKGGEPTRPERDPILELVQRLQGASLALGERDVGLAAGVARLAEQSAEPGRSSQPLFRTQVAYAVQDMERSIGAGRLAMPTELREEMTRLAATSPGLQNKQMEALVRSTPEIGDRGLVRDVRRSGIVIGGLGTEQNAPAIREQVEALENRVRLAARAHASVDPTKTRAERPEAEQASNSASVGKGPQAATEPPTAPAIPSTAAQQTRAAASPGGGIEGGPPAHIRRSELDQFVNRTPAQPSAGTPKSLMSNILDGMRSPGNSRQAPWAPPPIAMAERVSGFQRALDQGRTDQLIRASEKSGVTHMQAIETFAQGPGAGILGKIEAAASTEAGGMREVMSEMRPGGRYANLRSEFDDALQKDRVFAASYNQVEKTGAQFGRDRLALAGDFEAKKLNVQTLDARFQKADEAIGQATSRIPGRTPGKSSMDELGEKLAEILAKAVERVRTMFGREVENAPKLSASPSMSP